MRTLKIGKTDIKNFSIVLKCEPDPAEVTAAEFLQRVIKTSCGVQLNVTADSVENGIYLGFRTPKDEVKFDGFKIAAEGANLYLDGNIARGTLYAAYDFAEEFLGYRAFSFDCEVIPAEGDAEVPEGYEHIENPVFELRHCDNRSFAHHREFASLSRENGYGEAGDKFGGKAGTSEECHTFAALCPPAIYFDEHPEYYSLFEGKRIPSGNDPTVIEGQLCLTNPDVLKIVTNNVLEKLRKEPNRRIVDVSQNDNARYCQCENCARVDAEEGSQAGTMIRFANAVAESVEKEFPNVLIQTFAYQYSRKAPKITKARHNVLVRYCTIEACFRHALNDPNCKVNSGVFYSELTEWQKMADKLSIWDYICNYRCFVAPFPNLISLKENARFFADCHAFHLFEEDLQSTHSSAYGDLRAYLVGKLMWNPYMSDEEYATHIVEFLKAYYGDGWKAVAEYIRLEHDTTQDFDMNCFECADIGSCFYTPYPNVWEYMIGEYLPKAYQAHHPETYLKGFIEHISKALALWDDAFELAQTPEQKSRAALGKLSVEYIDLFNTPHDKKTMTDEEKTAYEARVEAFFAAKEKYDLRYSIWTDRYNAR